MIIKYSYSYIFICLRFLPSTFASLALELPLCFGAAAWVGLALLTYTVIGLSLVRNLAWLGW